jgi:hypothetical protein
MPDDPRARLLSVARARPVPKFVAAPRAHGGGLNAGLSGYWPFEERTGTRRARDASLLGNDCTLHRLKAELGWADARSTGSRSLGPGGWLHCKQPSLPPSTGAEFSAAMWMRVDRLRGSEGTLLSRRLVPGAEILFHFGLQGSNLFLRSSVWQPELMAVPLANPQGRWIHVAFSRRSDGVTKLFVDGAIAAEERARPLPAVASEEPLVIGAEFRGVNHREAAKRFIGAIDEVMIYDRALADEEVAQIASGMAPTTEAAIGPVGAN